MFSRPSRLPLALAGLLALAVAMGIGRFAFTPVLPMMQADLGMTLAEGGWLASANYLGYFVGALVATRLPWTPAGMLRRGLWLVVLMTATMGITFHWLPWLLWRFLAGVASAWVMIGTAALCIARLHASGRAEQGGVVFSGVGYGIAFAGLACMGLAMAGASSSLAWLLLALAALAGLVAASSLWRSPAPAAATARPPADPARTMQPGEAAAQRPDPQVPPERLHWGLILCYGVYGFGYILPATFLPAQARLLVPDPLYFSLAWPVFGLASAVSTLIASRLLRRYTRQQVWAGAQLIMALGVLMPALFQHLGAILVAAVCVGSAFMVITMVGLQAGQAAVGPHQAKVQIAAMTASFAIGQLAGPLFFSFTHLWFDASLEFALLVGAAGLIAGAVPILRLR